MVHQSEIRIRAWNADTRQHICQSCAAAHTQLFILLGQPANLTCTWRHRCAPEREPRAPVTCELWPPEYAPRGVSRPLPLGVAPPKRGVVAPAEAVVGVWV
eukprot:1156973-Pelagomonas_calceolata.AAC.5